MSKLNLYIFLYICFWTGLMANTDIKKKIEELEKEKDNLFKEINDAIDNNVGSLQRANATDAIMAVNYLRNLKEQITELNHSDIRYAGLTPDIANDTGSFRRKAKTKKSRDDFIYDLEKILKPQYVSEKKLKEILDNRDVIKKKLDDWILERQKEKEKIKKYKMQTKYLQRAGKFEKCPRFGYAGRKRSKKYDYASCKRKYKDRYDKYCNLNRSKTEKPPKTPTAGRKMYPCCRKCCKKSYMGCL